jgi:hypothetical protein
VQLNALTAAALQYLDVSLRFVVLVVVIDPPLCFKLTNLMKQHQHHLDW